MTEPRLFGARAVTLDGADGTSKQFASDGKLQSMPLKSDIGFLFPYFTTTVLLHEFHDDLHLTGNK